jgi:aspartyl-tRNA(Asn)/glutamyl-tRNA(Gln) amidotransferase subunit B
MFLFLLYYDTSHYPTPPSYKCAKLSIAHFNFYYILYGTDMTQKYIPTIGLEIHAELKTKTKMFCDSKNDLEETRPNVNICPVCMGHPGTLPVPNKEAIRFVLTVGVAVGGTLVDYSEFDRKNYFYPDIPKGYQISQYNYPLVSGGMLAGVQLTRIHLEEDTARSIHTDSGSLVDFNRAGVPLLELVTEPVIHSAEVAGKFAREFQLLLRTLGVSDADMEKGHMRVEANISVAPEGELGTKTEVKNLNSFRSAERAIAYEIERQSKLLDEDGEVVQETRGWDEVKQKTFSQRIKESADDYRYFPDPDIPKMKRSEVSEFSDEALTSSLPELPEHKRKRYEAQGIKTEDSEMFISDSVLGDFIDATMGFLKETDEQMLAVNYTVSDIASLRNNNGFGLPSVEYFAELIHMIKEGDLSSRGGKDVLKTMMESGGKPQNIAEEKGLMQESDEDVLKALAKKIVDENAEAVSEYKEGKESALQHLVGQGMKATQGSANPQVLQKVLKEAIN